MYDVIVIGGGPGGSIAAKRCARYGLRTLLLEKKRLPRDKVCTGMVMGIWAHTLIPYGFDRHMRPVWKDGCMVPRLHKALIENSFRPALHKVLLVGDAAGLIFPITYEGIGPALKSGFLATEAIIEASKTKRTAADIYLEKLRPVLDIMKKLYFLSNDLEQTAKKDVTAFPKAIKKAYEETLRTD